MSLTLDNPLMDTQHIELLLMQLYDLAGSKMKHIESLSEEVQIIIAVADVLLAHVLHNQGSGRAQ